MKKRFLFLILSSLILSSCIYYKVEEHELVVQAEGRIFERHEKLGLMSSGGTNSESRTDFEKLIKQYEPPIITPTPDKDIQGRIILRRELIRRAGEVDSLEEAIYPDGFRTKIFREIISNGYIWLPFSTNEYYLECNGEIVESYDKGKGKDKGVIVRWPTNTTWIWYKRTLAIDHDFSFADFYDAFLHAGRVIPWPTKDEKSGDEK